MCNEMIMAMVGAALAPTVQGIIDMCFPEDEVDYNIMIEVGKYLEIRQVSSVHASIPETQHMFNSCLHAQMVWLVQIAPTSSNPLDIKQISNHFPYNFALTIPAFFSSSSLNSFLACSFNTLLKILPLTLFGTTSTNFTPPRNFL